MLFLLCVCYMFVICLLICCYLFVSLSPPVPTNSSSPSLKTDAELLAYVKTLVPPDLDHTGAAPFDQHLLGVMSVLSSWSQPRYLQVAGLFHSIYGTEGFQGHATPYSLRDAVRDKIGRDAEQFAYWFCVIDRQTVDKSLPSLQGEARRGRGGRG